MTTAPHLVVAGDRGLAQKLRDTGRFPAVFDVASASEFQRMADSGGVGAPVAFVFALDFDEDIAGSDVASLANGLAADGFTVLVHGHFTERGDLFAPGVVVGTAPLNVPDLLAAVGAAEPPAAAFEERQGEASAPVTDGQGTAGWVWDDMAPEPADTHDAGEPSAPVTDGQGTAGWVWDDTAPEPADTNDPGEAANVSREAAYVPEEAVYAPREAPHVPGEAPHVPGERAYVPGEAAYVPGEAPHVPGEMAHVRGELAHVPAPAAPRRGPRKPLLVALAVLAVGLVGVGGVGLIAAGGPDDRPLQAQPRSQAASPEQPSSAAKPSQSPEAGPSDAPTSAPTAVRPVKQYAPARVRIVDGQVSIEISWTDRSGGKASYYVVGGPVGRPPSTLASAPPGTAKVKVNALNPSVNYCLTVVAVLDVDRVAHAKPVCTRRAAQGG